jgi:ABC-type uncharacterized transport system substrate-binding protein
VPKAVRIAVLINPGNPSVAEATLREVREAAPTMGLRVEILNAATIGEIDAAFATLARERPDALIVAADAFFLDRRMQFATLAARDRIPAAYGVREFATAGGLMSYGTNIADAFRQAGVYTGLILKGAKPADLPVVFDQVRVRHQPSDGTSARHRGAVRTALHCRRSDRIKTQMLRCMSLLLALFGHGAMSDLSPV